MDQTKEKIFVNMTLFDGANKTGMMMIQDFKHVSKRLMGCTEGRDVGKDQAWLYYKLREAINLKLGYFRLCL